MDEGNPLVSIIVRTKDRPELLKRAIASISTQVYKPIEVVLVNDGGCDLDTEELKGILGDVSLNYIKIENNVGRAHAGNTGIKHAKGQYIGFLDDDDEFYPEHVSSLVNRLENTVYKVAYTDSLLVHKEYNRETQEIGNIIKQELLYSYDFDYNTLIFENYIPFMCLLFNHEVLEEFDSSFDLYEDWDLLIRIGEKYPFSHIDKVTAHYNQWSVDFQISQTNKDPAFLKESYLKILSKHIDKFKPDRIHNYIFSRDSRLKNLEKKLSKKDYQIKELESILSEKDYKISAMINTRGWQLLEKYRRIRNRFYSPGFKEKELLAKKGLRFLKNEGFKSFLQKANRQLLIGFSRKRLSKPITMSHIKVNIDSQLGGELLQSKASVIIPTKNAGEEFDYTLRRITQQEGIGEIELIIVDSGSTDRTVDICKSYTQNIFQISPDEFHHARARNLGAEKATGDYLVFTVQDAIPVGNHWLYKLLVPIHQGNSSAVTVRQIPRSDADLFASWAIWGHNYYLGHDRDHISNNSMFANFDDLDIQAKRSVACLDNVCFGIRKTVFDDYKFHSGYAEDLELGIRLIKDGHTLMFESSNAVIHSHNRTAIYFFKRSYVDTVYLWNLLQIQRRDIPVQTVLEAISYLLSEFRIALFRLNGESKFKGGSLPSLIHTLVEYLDKKTVGSNFSTLSIKGDLLLDDYFKNTAPINHQNLVSEMRSLLISNLLSFLNFAKPYLIVEDSQEDFLGTLYKFFSITVGHYLGVNTHGQIDSLSRGI